MKINAEALFNAINNAKDKYIDEAGENEQGETESIILGEKVNKRPLRPFISLAALLAVAIGLGIAIPRLKSQMNEADFIPGEVHITAEKSETVSEEPKASSEAFDFSAEKSVSPLNSFGKRIDMVFDSSVTGYAADIHAEAGEPVYSVADGVVLYRDYYDVEYGNVLVIGETGSDKKISFGGLDFNMPFDVGERVKKGDIVGYIAQPFSSDQPFLNYWIFTDELPSGGYGANSAYKSWLSNKLFSPLKGRTDFDIGNRNPFNTFEVQEGETVYSPDEGKVCFTAESDNVGYVIGVTYENEIYAFFCNLDEKSAAGLNEGDIIKKGQEIGKIKGSSFCYYVYGSSYRFSYWVN